MDDKHARIWDAIEATGIAMLVTRFEGGLRARPMEPRPDREAGLIHFVTDVRGRKDDEIELDDEIGLIFVNDEQKAYLSITARAELLRDTDLARRIWQRTDDVWWPDGPADENVRVLRITPLVAELWDGPANSMVAAFELARARATGHPPGLGENRKITVTMH